MTLEEIFEEHPELLNNKSVQKLINHDLEIHSKMYSMWAKYKTVNDSILDLLMHSEVVIRSGMPSKETLEKIFNLYEQNL